MEESRCSQAIKSFLETLRGSFETFSSDEGCIIVTPFLRSDNECIEIELVTQPDGRLKLTDNCETVDYLFVNGLNVSRSKEVQRRVRHISTRFGVELQGDEVMRLATPDGLGQAMYSLVGALQEISYLIYRKVRRPPPTFDEEVERFLIVNDVAYDTEFKLSGKSREHTFKFYINERRRTLLETVTATSPHAALTKAERLAFRWTDIKDLQPPYKKLAAVDDVEAKSEYWRGVPINVLLQYSDRVISWSRKEQLMDALVAPHSRE